MIKVLKAIRPVNLFIIALLYGSFLFLEYKYYALETVSSASISKLILYTVSVLLITASGYLINDYYDVKTDSINKPEKTKLNQSLSLGLYLVFNACAIALLFFISTKPTFICVNVSCIALLWFYSYSAQKLPLIGNFIVALLTAILPILYLYVRGYYFLGCDETYVQTHVQIILYFYAILAFTSTLFREIIKDIEDIEGDKLSGYKTLPITTSVLTSKIVAGFFLLLTLLTLALFLVTFPSFTGISYYALLLISGCSLLTTGYLLIKAKEKQHFKKLSTWIKISMLSSFLFIIVHAITL